jgi:hypothetical protein
MEAQKAQMEAMQAVMVTSSLVATISLAALHLLLVLMQGTPVQAQVQVWDQVQNQVCQPSSMLYLKL